MVGSPEHSLKIVLIVRDINQFECIVFLLQDLQALIAMLQESENHSSGSKTSFAPIEQRSLSLNDKLCKK